MVKADKEDKEVIAEEGEGLIENEKTDDPDKTGEVKEEEEETKPKEVVVPKIDEVDNEEVTNIEVQGCLRELQEGFKKK